MKKKEKMSDNKAERSTQADDIVLNHTLSAMGMGLFPFPNVVIDVFAITTVQVNMIRQLCKVYDVEFKKSLLKGVISALTGTTLARVGAASLTKFIPGVGVVAVSVMAGASTYAVGEIFKEHFASGGTILDIDIERLKKQYRQKFEKGRQIAVKIKSRKDKMMDEVEDAVENAGEYVSDMAEKIEEAIEENFFDENEAKNEEVVKEEQPENEEKSQDEIIARLKELGDLKEKGILSEKEFAKMKERLLNKF